MEAVSESWLFSIVIMAVITALLIRILPEAWRTWKNKRDRKSGLSKEDRYAIIKEENRDTRTRFMRIVKWLFWI